MLRSLDLFFRHPVMGRIGIALLAIPVIGIALWIFLPPETRAWAVLASNGAVGLVLVAGVVAMAFDVRGCRRSSRAATARKDV